MTLAFGARGRALAALALAAALGAAITPAPADEGDDPTPPAQQPARPPGGGDADALPVGDASAGNVTGALQGQDGVRIQTMCTHCNSANIQVGGLVADLVPITFAGYPLFGGMATSFVMNVLPADSIAEAQVARGPGEPHAPGTAAGGTISLAAATPGELPWMDAIVDGGSFRRRAGALRFAGQVAPWLSGILTLGGEKADAVDAHNDGANSVPAIGRGYADLRADITPAEGHQIELGGSWVKESDTEGRGAVDVAKTLGSLLTGPLESYWTLEDTAFDRTEWRAGWEWRRTGGKVLTVRGLTAARDQDVESQDSTEQPLGTRYSIQERDTWGEIRYGQPLGLVWRVAAGAETNLQRVSADGFTPPPVSTLNQQAVEEEKIWSGFAEAGFNPSEHWDLLVGVRYDRALSSGTTTTTGPAGAETRTLDRTDDAWEPRLTLKVRPVPAFTLKLLAGRTFRVPRPVFTEVCCGRSYLTNVEAGVVPETATTAGLEATYQPSPSLKVSLYAAQTDFHDHILELVTYSQVYREIYANTNIPNARSRTAELSVRWTANRVVRLDASYGWLSFFNEGDRLVPVKYRSFSNVLTSDTLPIDRIPYRPESSGSIGLAFNLPRGVSVTAQGNYTGSQEIQQFEEFESLSDVTVANILLPDPRHVAGFWVTNLGVSGPVSKTVEISGGIDNVFNFVQTDLGEVTRDYNWGPLTGRAVNVRVRVHLGR